MEEPLGIFKKLLGFSVSNARVSKIEFFIACPYLDHELNRLFSLQEQINEETTTIDVRRPFTQFNHAVTVVEPEVSLFIYFSLFKLFKYYLSSS